jgi:hypothetical protein
VTEHLPREQLLEYPSKWNVRVIAASPRRARFLLPSGDAGLQVCRAVRSNSTLTNVYPRISITAWSFSGECVMIILMFKGVGINKLDGVYWVVEREMECHGQSCGHNYLSCIMRLFGLIVDSKAYRNTSGSSFVGAQELT